MGVTIGFIMNLRIATMLAGMFREFRLTDVEGHVVPKKCWSSSSLRKTRSESLSRLGLWPIIQTVARTSEEVIDELFKKRIEGRSVPRCPVGCR
jgi:hypothetical protein